MAALLSLLTDLKTKIMTAKEIILNAMQIDRQAFESGCGHAGDQFDILVEEVENYQKTEVNKLSKADVSWRRELLLAFLQHIEKENLVLKASTYNDVIEDFDKASNSH